MNLSDLLISILIEADPSITKANLAKLVKKYNKPELLKAQP